MNKWFMVVIAVLALALVSSVALAADPISTTVILSRASDGTQTQLHMDGLVDGDNLYLPLPDLLNAVGVDMPYRVTNDGTTVFYPIGNAAGFAWSLVQDGEVYVRAADILRSLQMNPVISDDNSKLSVQVWS